MKRSCLYYLMAATVPVMLAAGTVAVAALELFNAEPKVDDTAYRARASQTESRTWDPRQENVDWATFIAAPVEANAMQEGGEDGRVRSEKSQVNNLGEDVRRPGVTPAYLRAIAQGSSMTLGEATEFVADLDRRAVARFFRMHTHMNDAWLIRNGLSKGVRKRLLARFLSSEPLQPKPGSELVAMMSSYGSGGSSMYRAQAEFDDDSRTIYLHYTVPDDYQPDSVVLKWYDTTSRSLVHMDWHPISGNPQLMQEAWIRQSDGWEKGTYRVEVLAANESLQVLEATEYQVIE